jgi:gas vesicle structural protein
MAAIQRSLDTSSLAEVISTILDKGIVIDAWAAISLIGIQLITIEARVVIASVETYLKYAEAMGIIDGGAPAPGKGVALPAPSMAGMGVPAAAVPVGG